MATAAATRVGSAATAVWAAEAVAVVVAAAAAAAAAATAMAAAAAAVARAAVGMAVFFGLRRCCSSALAKESPHHGSTRAAEVRCQL